VRRPLGRRLDWNGRSYAAAAPSADEGAPARRPRRAHRTGVAAIDELLGRGGFARGELTELEGPTCSGKTQLALTAAALVALQGGAVLWIDSGSCAFSAARLHTILRARRPEGASVDDTLSLVRCDYAYDATALLALLDGARLGAPRAALIVVDSPFSVLAPNLGNCPHAHLLLARAARALSMLAAETGAAVVVTNHTVRAHDQAQTGGGARFGESWKGALGQAWMHAANTRLSLSAPSDSSPAKRRAACTKHPLRRCDGVASFAITNGGTADVATERRR